MRKSIFFLVGFFLLASASAAYAQLVLDKRQINLKVKPGEVITGSVTVSTPSGQYFTVKAYFEDVTYKPPFLGIKTLLPLGSTDRSCGQWITLSNPMFLLNAKGKQEEAFTIKVPKDIKGGYYCVLIFEKGASSVEGDRGVGIIERAGCTISLETADKETRGKISNISQGPGGIQGELSNLGNALLVADGSYYVMDAKGVVADRGAINKYYLPPGENTSFAIKLSEQVVPGTYSLVLNFDLEEGKALLKEIDLVKDDTGNINITATRD